jgi:Fur family ferric uptake transcriptional regulator
MNATAPRRVTRQRTAVLSVLDDLDAFHSAQEIHAELSRRGDRVGLSTVYRCLAALAEDGGVDTVARDDGETVYRRCAGTRHHHHLVCRECGATVEIDAPAVERWAGKVAADHGYDDVAHTVELVGRCASCRSS